MICQHKAQKRAQDASIKKKCNYINILNTGYYKQIKSSMTINLNSYKLGFLDHLQKNIGLLLTTHIL